MSERQYITNVREESIAHIKQTAFAVEEHAGNLARAGNIKQAEFGDEIAADLRLIADGLEVALRRYERGLPPISLTDAISGWSVSEKHVADHQDEKPVTLYVAGPMTGYDLWNFPAFHNAAHALREAGFIAIDPAELDLKEGFAADTKKEDLSHKNLRRFLARDLRMICEDADGIALLPGWEASKGANAEVATARALGLPCKPVEEWLP